MPRAWSIPIGRRRSAEAPIVVYGDVELARLLVKLLNQHEKKRKPV